MLRTIVSAVVGAALLAGVLAAPGVAAADPVPPLGTTTEPGAPGGTYVALTPTRVLDTRTGLGGTRGAGRVATVPLAGRYGIPDTGVLSVVLSVTVVSPSRPGYVSLDGGRTSIGNFRAGQTVAQLATSSLSYDGSVRVTTNVDADKVVDVVGWFTDPATAAAGAGYHPASRRLLDTRLPGAGGPTNSGVARRIVATGVPAGARAVAVDVTVVRPAASVYATAWAAGARPLASVVNAVAGEVRSTRAIVPLADDGSFQVAVVGGRSDLVVDLSGWFGGTDGAFFQPASGRLADSRQPSYLYADKPYAYAVASAVRAVSPPGPNAPVTVDPAALTPPVAAWLTLTVVSANRTGWTAATATRGSWQDPQPAATTSDVNWGLGVTANAVLAPVGTDGWVSLQGRQSSPPGVDPPQPDVVVDLSGVFVAPPVAASVPGLWEQDTYFSGSDPAAAFHAVPGFGETVVALAETSTETVALLADGTVLRRRDGQSASMVLDTAGVQVVGATNGVYVRRRDGTVWTNDYSEGASGVPGLSGGYRQVVGLAGVTDITAYHARPAAVLADGSVVQWGGAQNPQVTPVPLAGPVRDISAGWSGLACVAYVDGSVDAIRADGTRVHFDGMDAVEVATLRPDYSQGDQTVCFARDSQDRLHWFGHYGSGAESQRLIPGDHRVTAMASMTTAVSRGLTSATPLLRVIDDTGRVYDLEAYFTWVHQPGLDGATVLGGGGRYQYVFVPGTA